MRASGWLGGSLARTIIHTPQAAFSLLQEYADSVRKAVRMQPETVRSRLQKVMNGQMPSDRLPLMEWAMWWDLTVNRWVSEGLPEGMDFAGIKEYFGLDVDHQHWFTQILPGAPCPPQFHGDGWIETEEDYERLLPYLYPKDIPMDPERIKKWAQQQEAGEVIIWVTVTGFFWWPRELFGIQPHLFAFYDNPDLMHRMNSDQADYMLRCFEAFCSICTPDFMTFAEDMSYNHGPMISRELFDEFMTPYYNRVVPYIREKGIIPFIDSDGGIEPLVPWFENAGLEGISPLERMAGVDVNRIRQNHPEWKMIGGFDKMVMHLGEERMRQEFERLMPAMKSGYFIPTVDHQTPPGVSLEDYRLYIRLLNEYARKAVKD